MEKYNFIDCCLFYTEERHREFGNVKQPLILINDNLIIQPYQVDFPVDQEAPELHSLVLSTIEKDIRKKSLSEIFVGYEGFVLLENKSVKVLMGIYYSDNSERYWRAQVHGSAVGEWKELGDEIPLFGFEGLWNRAKSYLRN